MIPPPDTAPRLTSPEESLAWLECLKASASATQGMRSARTLAELADEMFHEWKTRRGP